MLRGVAAPAAMSMLLLQCVRLRGEHVVCVGGMRSVASTSEAGMPVEMLHKAQRHR